MLQKLVEKWRLEDAGRESSSSDIIESSCLTVVARCRPVLAFEQSRIENEENAVISSSSSAPVPEYECVSLSNKFHSIFLHREDMSGVDPTLETVPYRVHQYCDQDREEKSFYQSIVYDSLFLDSAESDDSMTDSLTSSSGSITLIAYGQTGSGKTHTISQLIHEAMSDLVSTSSLQGMNLVLSAFELYGEKCYDLLGEKRLQLKILEGEDGKVHAVGATEVVIDTTEEGQAKLQRALSTRMTCSTGANASSSRSHAFFLFKYREKYGENSGKIL